MAEVAASAVHDQVPVVKGRESLLDLPRSTMLMSDYISTSTARQLLFMSVLNVPDRVVGLAFGSIPKVVLQRILIKIEE
jgi:hypothetical protein